MSTPATPPTNASLQNQNVPIVDSSGHATREFWLLLVALFNRTGGSGSPVDVETLEAQIKALQQLAYVVTSASTDIPNSNVLEPGTGMSLSIAGGKVTLSLTIPVSVEDGGTGLSSLSPNAVIIGNGNEPPNFADPVNAGYVLTDGGSGVDPSFQAAVNSIVAGTGIAVSGATGNVTVGLQIPVSVADGGTGATTATAARASLSAAASGTNSDITSLTGLTTPLGVTEGGTGVATITPHGVAIGNGGGPIHSTAAGTAGQVLVSGGLTADPAFSNAPIITGGSIDGAPIGQTTPAAAAFTKLVNGETVLIHSSVTLSNSAAAAAGTLTNAPVAGNPTKWIAIDDNGTTRHIPAW